MAALLQAAQDPLIANTWVGTGRLVLILVVTVLAPIATYLVVQSNKGPQKLIDDHKRETDSKLEKMERDLDGLGKKVDTADKECAGDRRSMEEIRGRMQLSEADRANITNRLARSEGRMDSYETRQAEAQRDILSAISESGRLQQAAVHGLEVQVSALAARADFAREIKEGFMDMGDKIVSAMERREARERDEKRNQGGHR